MTETVAEATIYIDDELQGTMKADPEKLFDRLVVTSTEGTHRYQLKGTQSAHNNRIGRKVHWAGNGQGTIDVVQGSSFQIVFDADDEMRLKPR
jgi:hypothetical protein